MAVSHYFMLLKVFVWILRFYPVVCAYTTKNTYLTFFRSCTLAEATNQTMQNSDDCRYACLDFGSCTAYQWDEPTSTCRLQETLNVTASSSPRDTVGVLIDGTACPADYTCHVINTPCGTVDCICRHIADDCSDIHTVNPESLSGVYSILAGTQNVHEVWCDMDTDGGGWTVFLKRQDGSVDFYQDLATYKQGFGEVSGEYWLGLDVLHAMTSAKTYQLRADISDWEGSSVYSLHHAMVVAGESDNYTVTTGELIAGEGGDALSKINQMAFSTKDADRDVHSNTDVHCAERHHGGYWYKNCLPANPTGKYYSGGAYTNTELINDGIQWRTWSAHTDIWYSLKTVELKLRP